MISLIPTEYNVLEEYTMNKKLFTLAILTGKILNRHWKKLEDVENE